MTSYLLKIAPHNVYVGGVPRRSHWDSRDGGKLNMSDLDFRVFIKEFLYFLLLVLIFQKSTGVIAYSDRPKILIRLYRAYLDFHAPCLLRRAANGWVGPHL